MRARLTCLVCGSIASAAAPIDAPLLKHGGDRWLSAYSFDDGRGRREDAIGTRTTARDAVD